MDAELLVLGLEADDLLIEVVDFFLLLREFGTQGFFLDGGLTSGFVDFSLLLLGAAHQNSLFLQRELAVVLSLCQSEFVLLLASLGVSQVDLFDQMLGFYFVKTDFVGLVLDLVLGPFDCLLCIQGFSLVGPCFNFFLLSLGLGRSNLVAQLLLLNFQLLDEQLCILKVSVEGPFLERRAAR